MEYTSKFPLILGIAFGCVGVILWYHSHLLSSPPLQYPSLARLCCSRWLFFPPCPNWQRADWLLHEMPQYFQSPVWRKIVWNFRKFQSEAFEILDSYSCQSFFSSFDVLMFHERAPFFTLSHAVLRFQISAFLKLILRLGASNGDILTLASFPQCAVAANCRCQWRGKWSWSMKWRGNWSWSKKKRRGLLLLHQNFTASNFLLRKSWTPTM